MLTASLAFASAAAFAQTYIPREPGSTANTSDRPPADTPIPSYYQDSYRVYLKMKAEAHGRTNYTRASYAKMPHWSGLWQRAAREGVKFDPKQTGSSFAPHGPMTADLTPRYRAAFEEKVRQVDAGNEWDPLSDCLPAGYPRFLVEPFYREFIVTPSETWMIKAPGSEVRRIYTDGRGHVPDDAARPLWDGDSIGFWDGDTLVVHTIRVIHGEYQRLQPDYSDETSTVERIRMINPNTIEDDVTVWDPIGLRKPWHVVDHYTRVTSPGARIDMEACDNDNNVVRTRNGGTQFILPGETMTIERSYREPGKWYLSKVQKKLFAGDKAEETTK